MRRVPLRYDPGLWSMIFPLGMYRVTSEALGTALHAVAGCAGTWVAFAVWTALFTAMLGSFAGASASYPRRGGADT